MRLIAIMTGVLLVLAMGPGCGGSGGGNAAQAGPRPPAEDPVDPPGPNTRMGDGAPGSMEGAGD